MSPKGIALSSSLTLKHQMRALKRSTDQSDKQSTFTTCNLSDEPLIAGFALLRLAQLINFDIHYLGGDSSLPRESPEDAEASRRNAKEELPSYRTILDDMSRSCQVIQYLAKFSFITRVWRLSRICLSLFAIILSFDKLFSIVVLCLVTSLDKSQTGVSISQKPTNSTVSLLILVIINLSILLILFSTIFNGHLLWNLFSQRIFLVGRRFQYKSMMALLVFAYFEYLINIAFINNLYEWELTSNNIKSGSYSVLANLRIFATESDVEHFYMDIVLTVVQFARGIIRMSPYMTINYALVCLRAHIGAIRGQRLLVDSLKKSQKLRVVVMNSNRANLMLVAGQQLQRKKKVSFVTSAAAGAPPNSWTLDGADQAEPSAPAPLQLKEPEDYLGRVEDFEQLESYITNLYVFSGQLNRLMSRQGLSVFFIVHNLVISVSVIVPEAIRGGPPMVHLVRALVILIGLVPFVLGQLLDGQLSELSRQIDRIIIQRQFVYRRRDNLIRIRELIHDIKVKCGSMLKFNIETGIKYLVVAFATAFFIEQEHYKLTRRH